MRLTHLSIWAITSVIYSVQVRIIHLKWHVSSKTRHIICLIHHHDRYVDDVDVLLSSALYLLPRHKISFDHDHSINGRRSSSILLICQLTTLSACWDHPSISSSIILLARLLQSKSWAREIFISTAPKWHVCSQQAIILLWPYAPRLLWYISIHEIMSALAHRHIRWLSFASILELKLRELDIHICQVWYWYHLSSSSSISSMTPINSMIAMCYIFKSRVIWKSLNLLKLSNTLLFTTRSQEVVILEDECWFISVSRLHLPLQLVLDMVVSAAFCIKDQPSIYLCLQCALMKVERWCWCIIMSNHFCHTLLRSSYRWLCVLHRESRVNPISNKRCLLCISIVGLPEEQTLEIDTPLWYLHVVLPLFK